MKIIIRFIYCLYQICIALPLMLIATMLTAITTIIGCSLGSGDFWSYYPPAVWSRLCCWVFFLPVKVEGREHLKKGQSYIFVANHQGVFDIWMLYGFLGKNFKWMMKKELRKIPLVGKACEKANHLFIERGNTVETTKALERAREILRSGMSVCVFPEGTRTKTGNIGHFKRGAYILAKDIQLPVVPITINGSYDVLPTTRGISFVKWHRLSLTIHAPIPYDEGQEMKDLIDESHSIIESGLLEKE